ncbi:MAG: galactitol-1-phosphate 5-dehydrogenase [Lachnospiraceae bacterium]
MKAYVLHGIADLRYEEVEKPKAGPGEVLVKVMAAGICGSDIPRIYKTGAYHHPLIPGHEFSGQVAEVGEGVSKEWQGKRVGIFPLIPCMKCSSCFKKKYEMCSHYNYLGSRTDGSFAEYVRVPEWNLIELPENVSFEQAAMMEPMAVALHAIRQSGLMDKDGNLRDDVCRENIAIFGLGTIGLFITMFLQSLGCQNLYAAGNKSFQKKMTEKLGISAEHYCDIRGFDPVVWVNEKTEGEGVSLFFECVGKNEVLTQGLNCIAPGGTLLLVGNPATDMTLEKTAYWKILRRQITVQGTWNSSFTKEEGDDWHYVLNRLAYGMIHPEEMITHKLLAADMMRGFELMRDKSEDYVKVMGSF